MKKHHNPFVAIVALIGVIGSTACSPSGSENVVDLPPGYIPVSTDYKASYTEVSRETNERGRIVLTTRRVGPSGTSYAIRELDCKRSRARYLGEGDTLEAAKVNRKKDKFSKPDALSITGEIFIHACGYLGGAGPASESLTQTQTNLTEPARDDEDKNRMWIIATEQAVREHMRESSSVKFRGSKVSFVNGTPVVCGEVNAKNGFGGYSGFQRFIASGEAFGPYIEEMMAPDEFQKSWKEFC